MSFLKKKKKKKRERETINIFQVFFHEINIFGVILFGVIIKLPPNTLSFKGIPLIP